MAVTLKSLTAAECGGAAKVNGIATLYWIPKCDIDVYGTIADHTAADIEDIGKVTSAHTLVATKGFLAIPLQIHKNSLKINFNGENGAGNWGTEFSGLIPGFADLTIGTVNYMVRTAGLAIVEMPDGEMFQIGDAKIPAFTKADGDTETTDSSSATGFMLTVNAISAHAHKYDNSLAFNII